MQNVADDGDIQSLYAALVIAYGQSVEQRLRRVFVCAVARVDDGARQMRAS